MLSQNVLFVGESTGDDPHDHPPGASIAERIADSLREQGFRPGSIDNWRDCGWSVELLLGQAVLEIALASTAEPKLWMLQVACLNQPGFLARLFGAKKLDCSKELFEVASAIHRALVSAGYTDIRWRADDYPDGGDNSREPQQ